MTDDTYTLTLAVFDSGEARSKLRGATQIILSLEADYGTAVAEAAEAEGFYRLRLAEQFRAHRDAGAPVEAANIMARGDCAADKRATLEAAGKLKLAEKRLDDAVDTRRSLWRLIEWARARDTHSRPHEDERVPTGWP
jgi:ribosome-binding protein aMBF1 (putative translation factor)